MVPLHAFMSLVLAGFGPGTPTTHDSTYPALVSMPTESRAPTPQAITIPLFAPKHFPFVTTIPDDGTDTGGGWQVAKANLKFVRVVIPTDVKVWHCPFKIEMPLRTETRGKISPDLAATMSANVANTVDTKMDHSLPEGVFCHKFFSGMEKTFRNLYPGLGERLTK